jgi:hypothetical protein
MLTVPIPGAKEGPLSGSSRHCFDCLTLLAAQIPVKGNGETHQLHLAFLGRYLRMA